MGRNCKGRNKTKPSGCKRARNLSKKRLIQRQRGFGMQFRMGILSPAVPRHLLLFLNQSSHVLSTSCKLQVVSHNMFITMITNQGVIVMCRDNCSLQIYNLHKCWIGTGSLPSKQPFGQDVHKASFKGVCFTKRITRHGSWDLEETLLIGNKGISITVVAQKTDTLNIKLASLFVGTLFFDSSLGFVHIS